MSAGLLRHHAERAEGGEQRPAVVQDQPEAVRSVVPHEGVRPRRPHPQGAPQVRPLTGCVATCRYCMADEYGYWKTCICWSPHYAYMLHTPVAHLSIPLIISVTCCRSCQTESGGDDLKKGTQLLEIYALEIQVGRHFLRWLQ